MTPEMRHVDSFPHEVVEDPNAWIPMSDGARLAARIWRPADGTPVPAILEYLPYRKRFGTASRDALTHPYLAGHGYAGVRVDLRGSGESDGVLADEYLPQELEDGVEVIRWIAAQEWCDGNVGMMGISWGGFNALQVAALRPPALKAIVTLCSTDDRYADDIHYMGGCLLGDNLSWASVMFAYNTMPPDPELVGEGWREMWSERLEGSGLWIDNWLRHQRRDDFWKHGSVCEDYTAIQCPVYAVSGWADGYSNAVFRLLAGLDVPRLGLIGPWSHVYPHLGEPGPAIGFLQDMLRWWNHWLKGIETGIMDEPMLRVWMQDSVPPATNHVYRPGRWVAEKAWPSELITTDVFHLDATGGLSSEGRDDLGPLTISSPLTVGRYGGKWCSYVGDPDLPGDQSHDDGGSLVFETPPLTEPLEILGAPIVELEVTADQPVAMVACRLSDVDEDGRATRVTFGLLNLTHRASHEDPEPLEPGHLYRVHVRMNEAAQKFSKGHRIRLALSTSYWPMAWPPPKPVRLTLACENSLLHLPVRGPQASDDYLAALGTPEGAPPAQLTILRPSASRWLVQSDLGSGESMLEVVGDAGTYRLEDSGLEVGNLVVERYTVIGDRNHTARAEVTTERSLARRDWAIRTVTSTVLTCTGDEFAIEAELEAFEGERPVFNRTWRRQVPRDLV
ncbi:CocE/NonD family hydrolase [soil metagenome]